MSFKDSISFRALELSMYYRKFRQTYNFLKKSQYWSKDQLEEYQIHKLGELLRYTYDNVPYYKKIFDDRDIKPHDIQDLRDLKLLPFLTKEIIRNNLNDLTAKDYPADKMEYVTTGGTSGVPLGFYYEKGISRAIEWAFLKFMWERVGYRFRDKCVILKGDVVETAHDGIYWKHTFFRRWLVLSSYHMTDDNLYKYVKKIRDFKPLYIQAYPSTITILARYMKKNNIKKFESVKAILCGSENIYPAQRRLLEDVFDCRVFSWYGHSERVVLAGECEVDNGYHIFPEYGAFELVDKNGKTANGSKGYIVGTGLTNLAMPLIRYKTDDLAEYGNQKCGCGRSYEIIKNVAGRWIQEFILANNNRLIPITALNMHSDVFDNVEQFQFFQDQIGEVLLKIVKKPSFTEKDRMNILIELSKKMGDIKFDIEYVDEIPRSPRGKHCFLKQNLSFELND